MSNFVTLRNVVSVSVSLFLCLGVLESQSVAAPITWNATNDGLWNTTSTNWGGATTFNDGVDDVTFGNAGIGAITVSANMTPTPTMAVENTSGLYTFTGGPIDGGGSLTKSNNGNLLLASSNSYSGGTSVTGGILFAGHNDALGSGSLVLNGGTSIGHNGVSVSLPNDVSFGGGTIGIRKNVSALHTVTFTEPTPTITGDVEFRPQDGHTYLTIDGGIGDGGGNYSVTRSLNGVVRLLGDNSYTGGTINNSSTTFLLGDNSLATGDVTVNGGSLIIQQASSLGPASSNLILNGGGQIGHNGSDITIPNNVTFNPGTISITKGVSVSATLIFDELTPTITGDVTLSTADGHKHATFTNGLGDGGGGHSFTKAGTGTLRFLGDNTYTGATNYTAGNTWLMGDNTAATGDITITGAVVIVDQTSGLGTSNLILNHNAQLGHNGTDLTVTNNVTFNAGTIHVTKGMSVSATVTFDEPTPTITGDVTLNMGDGHKHGAFTNGIKEMGGSHRLTKIGTGKLTLNGDNTYTGGSTFSAAITEMNGSLATADIVIGSGATLNGSGTIKFTDGDLIDVDGTLNATNMLFDLTGVFPGSVVTVVDYSGGTFLGPGAINDLLNAASSNWTLTDTGSMITAFAPVPEPSSMLLLGLGTLGLVRRTRRRRLGLRA